jgi:hypothetical protein
MYAASGVRLMPSLARRHFLAYRVHRSPGQRSEQLAGDNCCITAQYAKISADSPLVNQLILGSTTSLKRPEYAN